MEKRRKIYVIGHKNPDTDSICSAIAYAYLKNAINTDENIMYLPKRAGQLNEETTYVLKKFGVIPPEYMADVSTQVRDIEIRKTPGVDRSISLKTAWEMMKELNVVTLPVVKSNRLEGVITTEIIAKSYMDIYDNSVLSRAHTKYKNIVKTLDGKMITGDPEVYYTKGKVIVAAGHRDMLADNISEGDFIIMGNRAHSQETAINSKASCIVVCDDAGVTQRIINLAKEKGCVVITSPHDTYTVARLINQSMPISYFMQRDNLDTFRTDDYIEVIKGVMTKKRHRDFPILDKHDNYVGMISRRNLLGARKKGMILVDHNEPGQAVDGLEDAEIIEIIDHHRLGTVETITPVFFRNQPLGCTATIVYQMFIENKIEIPGNIAGLLMSSIISDTLLFRSPTCTGTDRQAAEALAQIADIDMEEHAKEMFMAGSNLINKSPEEIFYQDFKKFSIEGVSFGIGQINSMSGEELVQIKDKLLPYLDKAYKEYGVDAMYFMLTNILQETTELIYAGPVAENLIKEAYGIQPFENSFILKDVVSRKKQLLPKIMIAIQQEN
ncbi:MAG: putative manganese-dependent inorganic diphosphatase [Eubacterium sp.]